MEPINGTDILNGPILFQAHGSHKSHTNRLAVCHGFGSPKKVGQRSQGHRDLLTNPAAVVFAKTSAESLFQTICFFQTSD